MSTETEPVIYVLDFNIGNATDDLDNPWGSGRVAVGTPSGGQLKTLIDHENRPDGIEILAHENGAGGIFWTQMGTPDANDGTVQACNLDGTEIQDIFAKGEIHTPKQIAIDEKNGKLYVSDREGLRVHRANLDGSNKEVIIQTGEWRQPEQSKDAENWCVGIAVDSKNGYFYWTQKGPSKGGKGRIFRAPIKTPKGSGPSTRNDVETLFSDLPEPIDLQIDTESQTLYWTDRGNFPKGNTLNRASVGGSLGQIQEMGYTVLARHLHEAIGLQIDKKNQKLWVSDLGGDVYRYDMDGSNGVKYFEGQGQYTGIALAHLDGSQKKELYGL